MIWIVRCGIGCATAFGKIEDEALRNHPADDFSDGPACGVVDRKRKNLIHLGVDSDHAYAWSRTRMGGWAVAQSPILLTTITVHRLKQRGYTPMLDVYYKLNPSLNEHLPDAGGAVCETRLPALSEAEWVRWSTCISFRLINDESLSMQ